MAGVADQAAVSQFLFGRLSVDTAVAALLGDGDACRLYPDLAPQDENGDPATGYPFAVYGFQASQARRFNGRRQRALSLQTLVIQCVVEGEDYGSAEVVLQAIDASLTAADAQDNGVDVNGVTHRVNVVGVTSETPRQADVVKGRQYRTVGRIYRVDVQGSDT